MHAAYTTPDELIHYFVAEQQPDGPLPGQQGVAMEDETE